MPRTIKLPQQEMTADALRALLAEYERACAPVEGQVYRHAYTTNANPYGAGYPLRRRCASGEWERKNATGDWYTGSIDWDDEVQSGELVPYLPPASTFKVGDWVTVTGGSRDGKAYRIEKSASDHALIDGSTLYLLRELRHATPEEIHAATRIPVKTGMLLKERQYGIVSIVSGTSGEDVCLAQVASAFSQWVRGSRITTEDYEVLPRYTIEGAQ